ncbi:MAG: TIGR03000 domain-containing protein [Gemmataceae bacterium]
MYSVVLMAALTATESAPAHGGHKIPYGVCYGPCYGACYTGYQGPIHAHGGWGMPYGGYWSGYACWGGCGGYASPAYGMPLPPVMLPSTYSAPDTKTDTKDKPRPGIKDKTDDDDPDEKSMKKKDKDKDDDLDPEKSQVRARVTFELPADAQLFVDDVKIDNIGERKSFRTPPLKKGEQYFYELRAEVVRDGKKIVENRKITITAGQDIKADFRLMRDNTGVANATAR